MSDAAIRAEAEDWLRRKDAGASMEDPSPLIQGLLGDSDHRDLDLIRQVLDLPEPDRSAAVNYLVARIEADRG